MTNPASQTTLGQGGAATQVHRAQAHFTGLDIHPRHYKSPQLYLERNGQKTEWPDKPRWFFATDPFSPLMKNMTESILVTSISYFHQLLSSMTCCCTVWVLQSVSGLQIAPDSLVVEKVIIISKLNPTLSIPLG